MAADTMPSALENRRSTGVFPSPQELAEYEQLVPGAGEKLLQLLQEQQKHRMELETATLLNNRREARLGQVSAFFLSILSLLCGFILSTRGIEVAGTILATSGLLTCVVAFLMYRIPGKSSPNQSEASTRYVDREGV